MESPTVVVGAGLAGLSAARFLAEAGRPVVVVDKGRSVGGRLATRRIGQATLDHGAQFFTVRTDGFAGVLEEAQEAGVAYEWCRGFSAAGDGYPRYAVHGGMNQLAKHLARGLDVSLRTELTSASARSGGWTLRHADGTIGARALVLTAPMPQSLALLDAGGAALDPEIRGRMDRIDYHPTLALLVALDAPPSVPAPGGVQLDEGPFGFVADNQAKGISSSPSVTLHASHELSRRRWDDDPEAVLDDLIHLARPWLGEAGIVEAQLKRWRYAQPVAPIAHEIDATTIDGAPLVFAGDAFAGAKVEGAFRSGRAAGSHLSEVLRPTSKA